MVTTYEGTHTHPCPITPRAAFGIMPEPPIFHAAQPTYSFSLISPLFQQRPFCPPAPPPPPRDDGLLQDMLPSQMFNTPKDI